MNSDRKTGRILKFSGIYLILFVLVSVGFFYFKGDQSSPESKALDLPNYSPLIPRASGTPPAFVADESGLVEINSSMLKIL